MIEGRTDQTEVVCKAGRRMRAGCLVGSEGANGGMACMWMSACLGVVAGDEQERVVGNIIRGADIVLGVWTRLLLNCTVTVTYSSASQSHEAFPILYWFYSRCIT